MTKLPPRVDDNEELYRILTSSKVPAEKMKVTPVHFLRRNISNALEPGLSLTRAIGCTPAESVLRFTKGVTKPGSSLRIARAQAKDLREKYFEVHATPTRSNHAHASLKCESCDQSAANCFPTNESTCVFDADENEQTANLRRRRDLADCFVLLPL